MEEWGNDRSVNEKIEAWEQELATWEQQIGRIRARQVELIRIWTATRSTLLMGLGPWATGQGS